MNSSNPTVIDVRTEMEFASGHAKNSINIPLDLLLSQLDEIKKITTPIVLCCASGNRSGVAKQLLAQRGIEATNGGSWYDVETLNNRT